MSNFIQISCTTPNKKIARQIGDLLLKQKLVSCFQILGPIISRYWWKEKIEKSKEWLCIIKTSKILFNKVEKSIKKIHPYEVPEIISSEISIGNKDYLKWIKNNILKK